MEPPRIEMVCGVEYVVCCVLAIPGIGGEGERASERASELASYTHAGALVAGLVRGGSCRRAGLAASSLAAEPPARPCCRLVREAILRIVIKLDQYRPQKAC